MADPIDVRVHRSRGRWAVKVREGGKLRQKGTYPTEPEARAAAASLRRPRAETTPDNTSGVPGVYWNRRDRRWMTWGRDDGKQVYLGSFLTVTEAAEAVAASNRARRARLARHDPSAVVKQAWKSGRRVELIEPGVAAAQLCNSGKFPTREEAAAALAAGAVETTYFVYEMMG